MKNILVFLVAACYLYPAFKVFGQETSTRLQRRRVLGVQVREQKLPRLCLRCFSHAGKW